MARIPYPETKDMRAENADLFATLPQLNVFRMLTRAGTAFAPFMSLVNAYLNEGSLAIEMRELVILRVGHLSRAKYEIWQHERLSRELGMSDDKITAANDALPSKRLSDMENAILQFTDDVVENVRADDATFAKAREFVNDDQLTELLVIIGVYMLVCRFLETLDIEIEGDVPEGRLEQIKAGIAGLS